MKENNTTVNVEVMIKTILEKTNALVSSLGTIDPTSEAYGVALSNLAKSFAILSGSLVDKKDGK